MKAESRAAGASRRDGPSEEQVRDFIAANRDFFERHPDLLAGLRVRS